MVFKWDIQDINIISLKVMLNACGVEFKKNDDGSYTELLYLKNSPKIADGKFNAYFPKLMGFGKSDKISTTIKIINGELISWKRFNKYGDVAESWNK